MKQNRHQKIAELVSRYEIETQEELAGKIKGSRFTVTQATISRDIRQMNLSKLPGPETAAEICDSEKRK